MQNADDVDDLRAALGLEKISLLGFSYGTLLGLTVVQRHGGHEDMLPRPEVRTLLKRFFAGQAVSAVCIAFPPPSFVAIREP